MRYLKEMLQGIKMLGNIRVLENKVCKSKMWSVFDNSLNIKVFMRMRIIA